MPRRSRRQRARAIAVAIFDWCLRRLRLFQCCHRTLRTHIAWRRNHSDINKPQPEDSCGKRHSAPRGQEFTGWRAANLV